MFWIFTLDRLCFEKIGCHPVFVTVRMHMHAGAACKYDGLRLEAGSY